MPAIWGLCFFRMAQTGRLDPPIQVLRVRNGNFRVLRWPEWGGSMTVSEKIGAYLREATGLDRKARLSDFQMQARKDAVEIVNLKTQAVRVIPVDGKDVDEDFGDIR
jgi:hypothetical protein